MDIAATISSHINDAYKVLSNPITRAEYILTLNGSPCSSDDHANMSPEFFADVMELNEDIDKLAEMVKSTDSNDPLSHNFEEVAGAISSRWSGAMDSVKQCIEQSNWDGAHQALSQLRYYERLRNRLRDLVPAFNARNIKTPTQL